jgi:phage FluMu protein gp41
MRRRSKPHTFDERLNAEKARIEAALESAGQSPQRDLLELKLRQIETVREIKDSLSSTRPQPSRGRDEP